MLLITCRIHEDGWEVIEVDENQNNGNPLLKPGDYVTYFNDIAVYDKNFDNYI
jgi:regulator of sigma E protease